MISGEAKWSEAQLRVFLSMHLIGALITRSARKLTLHLPKRWPWAEQFNDSLTRLRAVVLIT